MSTTTFRKKNGRVIPITPAKKGVLERLPEVQKSSLVALEEAAKPEEREDNIIQEDATAIKVNATRNAKLAKEISAEERRTSKTAPR